MSSDGVYLLGTGTCRVSPLRAQNSACIINGTGTFLFDCGAQIPERLVQVGGLDNCRHLHIHISHRHTDHVLGIFQLLQCLTWSDDPRHRQVEQVYVHGTEEVCGLINNIRMLMGAEESDLIGGNTHGDRILTFCTGPDHSDWTYNANGLSVASIHLPKVNNHGVKFTYQGKVYAFTGDALIVDEQLFQFAKDVDVLVFDLGHIMNIQNEDGTYSIDLAPAAKLLAMSQPKVAYATHLYLRHLSGQYISEPQRGREAQKLVDELDKRARDDGFTGRLFMGEDLQPI